MSKCSYKQTSDALKAESSIQLWMSLHLERISKRWIPLLEPRHRWSLQKLWEMLSTDRTPPSPQHWAINELLVLQTTLQDKPLLCSALGKFCKCHVMPFQKPACASEWFLRHDKSQVWQCLYKKMTSSKGRTINPCSQHHKHWLLWYRVHVLLYLLL